MNTGERGAAAVEFAIILPILVLLVMGIIEFGRAYNATIELTGAVREGARELALGPATMTAAEVEEVVANAAPSITPTVTEIQTCSGAGGDAEVVAEHSLGYTIPFFSEGTWTLSARGVMRCGL
jgi:Flp pilus assembly protein TadG